MDVAILSHIEEIDGDCAHVLFTQPVQCAGRNRLCAMTATNESRIRRCYYFCTEDHPSGTHSVQEKRKNNQAPRP